MLREHREQQKKLLPLFSPKLRPIHMAFAKGLWDIFLIFTVVFWISISFLYSTGYNTMRHIKDATLIFYNFDDSPAATNLSLMIVTAFKDLVVLLLKDYIGSSRYNIISAIKDAVWKGDVWGAVIVNNVFSANLDHVLTKGAIYNATSTITLVTEESHHYFKVMMVNKAAAGGAFAKQTFAQLLSADGASVASIIDQANAEALITPFSFATDNVAPYHFDMSMYILSVTLSLCMVIGSFIPSNTWKSIKELFFNKV
ncbi:hypothetical protein IWW55_000705 [Coemansia sp. RSA 2706]|nr:hypothetical protein IWW55_000705 [Coemansia sp. RSA 2706]KAJ2309929.1 hypothetical protein IWW54_003468 [Coemansia sp. RSA 2705]KAJ2321905.1 hypothetical protein IWW52_000435 [Coemansia sp. RSA 2704]KAJ2327004.1 hypothetical protein IWW51_001981 [Coemansia sp. RSA 2702]KAJ2739575.1 hypothetical protein H4R23_000368 [Coemansia sp. Cherry 401B]